jgi:hypothetical protein
MPFLVPYYNSIRDKHIMCSQRDERLKDDTDQRLRRLEDQLLKVCKQWIVNL